MHSKVKLKYEFLLPKKIIPAAYFCCQKINSAAQKIKKLPLKKIILLPKVTNLLPILQTTKKQKFNKKNF
jgi:hypothetical protein